MALTAAGNTRSTTFDLNGRETTVVVQPRTLLSDTIRHTVGEHGTHVGCEQGACGACTVIVDGVARRSCLTLTPQVDGCRVETIESVATPAGLDPVQQAIHDHHEPMTHDAILNDRDHPVQAGEGPGAGQAAGPVQARQPPAAA